MDKVIIWGSSSLGPHAVRTHGTLLTFADNPTDIDVFIDKDLVRVRFEFPKADQHGLRGEYATNPGIPGDSTNPATIVVRFWNLLPGTTVSDGPLRFATIEPIGLWLAYEIHAVVDGSNLKRINYTIWDGVVGDKTNYSVSPQVSRRG